VKIPKNPRNGRTRNTYGGSSGAGSVYQGVEDRAETEKWERAREDNTGDDEDGGTIYGVTLKRRIRALSTEARQLSTEVSNANSDA
jgi:hypothetical protein